jgi:probable rRNA maturation factor
MSKGPGGRRRVVPDIAIESDLWRAEPQAEGCVRDALDAAASRVPGDGEVSVLLSDDETVRVLNRQWRGLDKPTNVLSFPAAAPTSDGVPPLLGDIAIAYETLAREASEEGKPVLHHLAHLVVHGYLHLMGYDHQSESEAEAMESLERDILLGLRIPDPYRADAPDAA